MGVAFGIGVTSCIGVGGYIWIGGSCVGEAALALAIWHDFIDVHALAWLREHCRHGCLDLGMIVRSLTWFCGYWHGCVGILMNAGAWAWRSDLP